MDSGLLCQGAAVEHSQHIQWLGSGKLLHCSPRVWGVKAGLIFFCSVLPFPQLQTSEIWESVGIQEQCFEDIGFGAYMCQRHSRKLI